VKAINEKNNFFYFSLSLIALLLASAITEYIPSGLVHALLKLFILGTLVVAYISLNFGARWRQFVTILIVLLIVINTLGEVTGNHIAGIFHLLVTLAFFIGAAYMAGKQVLFSGTINGNTIAGSVAIYLLMGLIWATLYLLLLEFIPAPFTGLEVMDNWADNFGNAVYYSYITLTTVGYGDISPTSPLSHTVVYLEAISGSFYMAIVVASLVGARAGSDQ
jgi:voltage-gated potassium channel